MASNIKCLAITSSIVIATTLSAVAVTTQNVSADSRQTIQAQSSTGQFKNGARVMIRKMATNARDGHNISAYQTQLATVVNSTRTNYSWSHNMYTLRLDNGQVITGILEQDIVANPYSNVSDIDSDFVISANRVDGLYLYTPWSIDGNANTGDTSRLRGQVVHVSRSVTTANNGVTWYLANINGRDVYVDARAFTPYQRPAMKYKANTSVMVRHLATNAYGGDNIRPLQNQLATIVSATPVNYSQSVYYYTIRTADGYTYSNILEQDLIPSPYSQVVAVNKEMTLSGARDDGLYANTPWSEDGAVYSGTTRNFNGQRVQAKALVTTVKNNVQWYLVSFNGHDYYVDARNPKDYVRPKSKYQANDSVMIRSLATNAYGGRYIGNHQNELATIVDKTPVDYSDSKYYYTIKLADGTVLNNMLEQDLIDNPYSDVKSEDTLMYVTNKRNDGLFSKTPWSVDGNQFVGNSRDIAGAQVRVLQSVTTKVNGVTWKLIQRANGSKVYIDARGLVSSPDDSSQFSVGGQAYIKSSATGTMNHSGDLANYQGQHVTVVSATRIDYSNSHWAYTVRLSTGRVIANVLEQDLQVGVVKFNVDTNHMIDWMRSKEGQITYSMYGSRNGDDGTADCSGFITQAMRNSGASPYSYLYSTETIHDYLKANGFKLIVENSPKGWDAKRGDIVVWGKKGFSSGAGGHIGIMTSSEDNPSYISCCYLTRGQKGTAVQEVRYNQFAERDDYPYYYVYRQVQ